jgi:hypothetical protein
MYSKKEASKLRQEFWTTLGQYMSPIVSAEGEKVNWINYKTGVKDVYFRMEADHKTATLSIELRHKDPVQRQVFYEHFLSLEKIFTSFVSGKWQWLRETIDEHGKPLSRIFYTVENVNIFSKEAWPEMIRVFKTGLIEWDQFWNEVKPGFELLSN